MKHQQLTEGKRYQIAILLEDNHSFAEIARRIGVHKTTIAREIKRNSTSDGYDPEAAQIACTARKAAWFKNSDF